MSFGDALLQVADGAHAEWAGLVVDHVDGYLIAIPDYEVVGRGDATMVEVSEQRRVARDVGAGFELRFTLLVPTDKEVIGQWRLIAIEQREGGQDVAELGGREVVESGDDRARSRRSRAGSASWISGVKEDSLAEDSKS